MCKMEHDRVAGRQKASLPAAARQQVFKCKAEQAVAGSKAAA